MYLEISTPEGVARVAAEEENLDRVVLTVKLCFAARQVWKFDECLASRDFRV